MKIEVKNMFDTGVTIKEVHIIFTHEIEPGETETIDTDIDKKKRKR